MLKRARIVHGSDLVQLADYKYVDHECSHLVVVLTDDSQPPERPSQPYCGLRAGETVLEKIGDDRGEPEDMRLSRDLVWTAALLDRALVAEAKLAAVRVLAVELFAERYSDAGFIGKAAIAARLAAILEREGA